MRIVRDLARRPIVLVALLLGLVATAPACRSTSARPSVSAASTSPPAQGEPKRERATGEELARYAERERSAAGLEKFQGGAMDTGTIIIVLLLVIVIILIV
jgi:hypothetical protein